MVLNVFGCTVLGVSRKRYYRSKSLSGQSKTMVPDRVHTAEVAGSNPASPTESKFRRTLVLVCLNAQFYPFCFIGKEAHQIPSRH